MNPSRILTSTCAIGALALSACAGPSPTPDPSACEAASRPEAPTGPLIDAASHLSQKPAVVFVARDVRAMVETARKLSGLDDPATRASFYKTFEREFAELEGSPFELEFFTSAGVDTSAPVLFAISDEGPAFVVKIADDDAWMKWVSERTKQPIVPSDDFPGEGFRIEGSDARWVKRDGYICFAWDDDEALPIMCSGASRALTRPLSQEPGFQAFVTQVMGEENVGGVYLAARERDIDTMRLANLFGSVTGLGLAGRFEGEAIEGRAWFGVSPDAAKTLTRALTAPTTLDLSDAVGTPLVLARASFDPGLVAFTLLDLFNADSKEDLEETLFEVHERLGIDLDLNRDLADRSGGHAWFALIEPDTPPDEGSISDRELGGLVPMLGLDTRDAASTDALLDLFQRVNGVVGAFMQRDLGDGVVSFTLREPRPPSITFGGTRVLFSVDLTDDEIVAAVKGGGARVEGPAATVAAAPHGALLRPRALFERFASRGERPIARLFPETVVATAAPTPVGVLADVRIPDGSFLSDFPAVDAEYRKAQIFNEAEWHMRSLTDSCKSYFTSEQKYSQADGREPWHAALPGPNGSNLGYPVAWVDYVFIGGTDFTLSNMRAIPRDYERLPSDPVANKHKDAALNMIYGPFGYPTAFRYTITTGPGTGYDATCTVTAEADLDPTSTEVHTITQTVSIDPNTQEVLISPVVVTNEFE